MNTVRDLLVSAVEEQRPIVLILGQDAWAEPGIEDPVLLRSLERLGRGSEVERGWPGLLGTEPIPSSFYEWLSERFERRVHPAWLSALAEMPLSAVFTSALDPTVKVLLQGRGREPEVVLTANEIPRAARSRARPPLYYLFGRAGSLDPQAIPPADRSELNTRRIVHALPVLSRVLDAATALGLVIVDGVVPARDWLRIGDVLGALGRAGPEQVLWFGGRPELGADDTLDFEAAVESRRILVEDLRLGSVVAELHALGRLTEFMPPESQDAGIISFSGGGRLETTPEEKLRVEAVASIVDDAWTAFLPPLGLDAEYDAFRRFHGDLGGGRHLVEGVRREFAIERDFEQLLLHQVTVALADHANVDAPIIVHGQSGTGKSVALARVVARVREAKRAGVLYAIGRIPQPQEISSFCEEAEKAGAEATLVVCDANRDVDAYYDLLMSMRSRGRRVIVLGSRYRIADSVGQPPRLGFEAPSELSQNERTALAGLLERFLTDLPNSAALADDTILGFLYRCLPLSRARIAAGLGTEATAAEHKLRARGRVVKPSSPNTDFAQKLIEAGLAIGDRPLFDEQQVDALESTDAAGRVIDLVMVAGSLNCDVPVNLLLRAVTNDLPGTDITMIAKMFGELDLFRWKWADEERSELLVLPRLTLEAELICRRRLGSPQREAERLIELIRAVGSAGCDSYQERGFLLTLLQQIGDDGPRGTRYKHAYAQIARTLTELRQHFGLVHAGLILQESAFRRAAVRDDVVEDGDRVALLEEARDAVQAALDGIADGTMHAPRRTRQNLQVERASLYGFITYDRAARHAPPAEIWSSYEAARTAIRHAVSVTDNYYPFDVGLWTPADILGMASFSDVQKAEIEADIYATLDQVAPDTLPPKQREKFDMRQLKVGYVLENERLAEDAYDALETTGSTAGYFLRARNLAPDFSRDTTEGFGAEGRSHARRAAEFLSGRFDKIELDERCLSLLLECRWIAEVGRRPLRGQRQPLPVDDTTRRDLLAIVQTLNHASGDAARHVTRYLEAVLTWVIGDEQGGRRMFRDLSKDTEYEDPSRVVQRHQITGADGEPYSFEGRVEREVSEGHWVVRVEGLKQTVRLLSRDFPREEISYGRGVKGFAIAFNFIGPIADPIRPRR